MAVVVTALAPLLIVAMVSLSPHTTALQTRCIDKANCAPNSPAYPSVWARVLKTSRANSQLMPMSRRFKLPRLAPSVSAVISNVDSQFADSVKAAAKRNTFLRGIQKKNFFDLLDSAETYDGAPDNKMCCKELENFVFNFIGETEFPKYLPEQICTTHEDFEGVLACEPIVVELPILTKKGSQFAGEILPRHDALVPPELRNNWTVQYRTTSVDCYCTQGD